MIRPAAVGVGGRTRAVGDGVAEGYHDTGSLRRPHLHSSDEEPGLGGFRLRYLLGRSEVSRRRDVARLRRRSVRSGRPGVGREVDADRQIGQRQHIQIHWITEHEGAHGNRDGGLGTKSQRPIRRRLDLRPLSPRGDVNGSDLQGKTSMPVGESYANTVTADRGVHDLTQSPILEGRFGHLGLPESSRSARARAPGRHPGRSLRGVLAHGEHRPGKGNGDGEDGQQQVPGSEAKPPPVAQEEHPCEGTGRDCGSSHCHLVDLR